VTVKTVKGKIQIDVEATTEGAVRGFDRLGTATDKSRKAVEKNDVALKKARLEYQVAQARAENLAASQAKVTARSNEVAKALDRAAASSARSRAANVDAGSSWGSMAAGAGKVAGAIGLATAAGIGAASMASDLAKESLQVQGVFNNLPYALAPARTATRGLADDMTLARLSIMANQSGVAKTAQEFGNLAGMAQTLAMKMGRDVNDTIERVTMGIAKQEREILDELVILPRMEEMWAQHARTLGKTTAELSDHEKTAAFTQSALEALRRATQGVEVDMGGAAGAISRATVQAKNLQTAVLGGEEATITLDQGLRAVALTFGETSKDIRTYGADADKLRQQLRDLNVGTEALSVSNRQLGDNLDEIRKQELGRLENLVFARQATDENIEQLRSLRGLLHETTTAGDRAVDEFISMQNQQEVVARNAARAQSAELEALQLSIAFLQGKGDEEKLLNAALDEELELRIKILEAEGKSEDVAKLRAQQRLDEQRRFGEELRPKRGGGRSRRRDAGEAERREAFEQQKKTAAELDGLFEAMFKRRQDIAAEYDPFSERNLERQLANVIDFEDKRAAVELSTRLREIEVMRANGMDPVAAAQAEADAQIKALAVLEEVSDRRFAREIQLAEMQGRDHDAAMLRAEQDAAALDFKDQAEAQYHSVAMERLAERQRMEAEVHDRRMGIAQESMDLALGAAQAIVQGAVIEGHALRSVVAATAKSEAMRHGLVLGPSALVGAGFQFAWGNIPQGTALLQSAGQSFAFAASMAAIGGAVGAFGGGGGRGKSVGGFGAEAFGPGAAANGPMESRSGSGGSWDIGGSVPLSKETQQRTSASAQIGSAWSSGPGAPITNNFYVTGAIDDLTAQKMTQAQSRANARQGKLTAGRRG
jgi:hypothetical protein